MTEVMIIKSTHPDFIATRTNPFLLLNITLFIPGCESNASAAPPIISAKQFPLYLFESRQYNKLSSSQERSPKDRIKSLKNGTRKCPPSVLKLGFIPGNFLWKSSAFVAKEHSAPCDNKPWG